MITDLLTGVRLDTAAQGRQEAQLLATAAWSNWLPVPPASTSSR
jgi:hypothetical protein